MIKIANTDCNSLVYVFRSCEHYENFVLMKIGKDKQLFVKITAMPVFMRILSTFLKLVKEQRWTDSAA